MSRSRGALVSLSGLGRALVWLATLGVLGLAAATWAPRWGDLGAGADGADQAIGRVARRVIVYRIDPVRPTVFRFTQPVSLTRIITQPVLVPGAAAPGRSWTYAIRVDLLDESGATIETHQVHARTVLIEPDGTRRGPLRYYRGSTEQIAPADEVRIASKRPFAAIRVLTGESDPEIAAIDLRVGEQRHLIDSAAESAFVRFSPEDRQRHAAANAFPPELLTREERIAIARIQWRPVGPLGIDGHDYRMGVLYEETEGDAAGDGEGGTGG